MKKILLLALGVVVLNTNLMAKMKYKSEDLTFKQAKYRCDHNKDAEACMWAGVKAWSKRKDKLGFIYSKKGCDLKDANACLNTAYNYKKGYGVKKSKKMADKYYKLWRELKAKK